jgi:hypothetical protein
MGMKGFDRAKSSDMDDPVGDDRKSSKIIKWKLKLQQN